MSNQRKRTYETYQQSRLHRRSISSVYWAESSSTLTASSQQSQFDMDNDQGNWCAEKMRKQRYKMEKLLLCYEQQRKCIKQLEEYIDELQKSNNIKEQQIKRLRSSKQKQFEMTQLECLLQKQTANDQKIERNKMISLINGQLRLYDLERHRFQKEIQAKEQQLIDQKQALQQQNQEIHKFYKDKILKTQMKWINIEKQMANQIDKLQREKISLQEVNKILSQKLENRNQFQEMLELRRQLSKRENQISSNAQKKEIDNQVLREELQKGRNQIKKLKKENCKLRNEIQTKMFDYEMQQKLASNMQAKRQKSAHKQDTSAEQKLRYERLAQQLKKVQKELEQCQRKCRSLSNNNIELQGEIDQLKGQFTERKQKQKKLDFLRKQEHKEIEHLNRLFRKIDFNI